MNAPAKTTSSAVTMLTSQLAQRFDMGDVNVGELIDTLKQTAFKGQNGAPPTDAQMTALLIVAKEYGLNPWLKEIHAFPAKGGGIVPVVGVDGWSNIINNHPQMDGMEFEIDWTPGNEHITCSIWRKDRNRPTKISEFLKECKRGTEPWQMEKRMLRHKAMIQCGRVTFGYGNIYDPDEANDVLSNGGGEKHMGPADVVGAPPPPPAPAATYPAAEFDKNLQAWAKAVGANKKTRDELLAMVQTKGALTEDQLQRLDAAIEKAKPIDASTTGEVVMTYAQVAERLNKADDADKLAVAGILIATVADEAQRKELTELYDRRADELNPA